MAAEGEFPRGLHANALTTVNEDAGPATPSHGGTVTAGICLLVFSRVFQADQDVPGHEYDMQIERGEEKAVAQAPTPPDTPSQTLASTPTPAPAPAKLGVPRQINPAAIAARRPVSMPPQTAASAAAAVAGGERISMDENREREKEARRREKGTDKSRGRVLGDYVLTKTLGAGSMGKVKLAVHTPTGEKVSRTLLLPTLANL